MRTASSCCGGRELLGRRGLVPPGAEVGARGDDPRIGEARGRRRERLDRGRRGVAELAAVAVGDGGVADVVVPRRELPGGALEEERRGRERGLEHLARRSDVVGREEPVRPGERGRVAGVVEERRRHGSVPARDTADEQGVVGVFSRVVAACESLCLRVPEVPVRGEPATAVAVGDECLRGRRLRLDDRVADLRRRATRGRARSGPSRASRSAASSCLRRRACATSGSGAPPRGGRSAPSPRRAGRRRRARTGTSRCRARRARASVRRRRAERRPRRSRSADGAPPRRRRASPHPMSASRSRQAVSRRGARRRSGSAWSEMSARSCLDLPCGLRCGRGPAAQQQDGCAGRRRRVGPSCRRTRMRAGFRRVRSASPR